MKRHLAAWLLGLLSLFILLRLPGLDIPYQQDEFKNVVAAEAGLAEASNFFFHPPLTALLLRADAVLFGGEYMRVLPLCFGVLSALLLFAVVRRRFDEPTALASLALYTVGFFGIWASLMIDTDGAILPTLFLGAVYCYDRARDTNSWWWAGVLTCLVLGLLVKLSFIIVVGAILIDCLYEYWHAIRARHVWYGLFGFCGFVLLSVVAFATLAFLNPAFRLDGMLTHALSYAHIGGRAYLQIVVQGTKALYYLSPLLLIPLFLLTKENVARARIFVVYLLLGVIFYFILFDFSRGALDKYLMYAIIPFAVLSGAILVSTLRTATRFQVVMGIGMGIFFGLLVFLCNFLPQIVVPLYPKTEWFGRVLSGKWNVLTPFNGGSGPVGFYVSFLMIGVAFLLGAGAALVAKIRPALAPMAVLALIGIGLTYNAVFLEEFAYGEINGSAPVALASTLSYIAVSPEVGQVLTYNDIGAYELTNMGKYAGRFYAAPQFEEGHKKRFSEHTGSYLVVGLPPLYEGFYKEYFSHCAILFETSSKVVVATVYSCKQGKQANT